MAFLTRVLVRSHEVPPSLSSARLRGAAVFLDEVEPLDGHEQLVFAEVAQLHEFLHGVADADLFEPDEPADAVIDVHDEVVDLQIAQVREERLRDGTVPVSLALDLGALFFEDVRLGNDLQLGARQPEALRQLPDGDVDRDVEQLVGAIDEDAAEPVLGRAARPCAPLALRCRRRTARCRRARASRLTSAIHSWMRPRNSTAGWHANVRAWPRCVGSRCGASPIAN